MKRSIPAAFAAMSIPAAFAAMLAAAPVAAQTFTGPYVAGAAGYDIPDNVRMQTPTGAFDAQAKGGIVGLGSVGYGFGNGFRFELEGNYRNTGISGVANGLAGSASGTAHQYGAMANVLFDMDIGLPWLYPYIGGGVGYGATRTSGVSVPGLTISGTKGRLAAQAIAGLSFPIPNVPGLSVTSEYRFHALLGDATFDTVSPTGARSTLTARDSLHHGFLLGVRYAFGVQPPPTAPAATSAPAAVAARSFLVFFDWDKATLTDRARAVVKEAAEASTKVAVTRIETNGYTDASGTPAYNQTLSRRRAEAVAAELVKLGVPKQAISIQGFGETKPLVPTGANGREPQNRRVEIVLK